MSASIRATDEIQVTASPAAVYRVLTDFEGYGEWWPPAVKVRALTVVPDVVGSDLEFRPRGGPAFRCRVEQAVPDSLLSLRYHEGPYAGLGIWSLEPVTGGTRVRYSVNLTSEHRMLRFFARFTDLGRSHSRLMGPVLAGLRRVVAGETRGRMERRRGGEANPLDVI
jgi:uncharacterized protein YndB with AHSA1/START domain